MTEVQQPGGSFLPQAIQSMSLLTTALAMKPHEAMCVVCVVYGLPGVTQHVSVPGLVGGFGFVLMVNIYLLYKHNLLFALWKKKGTAIYLLFPGLEK